MTLTEFLLARIADDEATADDLHERDCASVQDGSMWGPCECAYPERVLAECEAKRRIVEIWDAARYTTGEGDIIGGNGPETHHEVLQRLAAIYADHPDYRDEWKP